MDTRTILCFIMVGFFPVSILSVSSTDTILTISHKNTLFSMIPSAVPSEDLSRNEVELKYYIEENLDQPIGVCVNATWQAAIRLTQDEMAAYQDWI